MSGAGMRGIETAGGEGWTDARTAELKRLHQEGLSCSQIAKRLGGVTRNAVIGKVSRLGLSFRPKASAPAVKRCPPKPKVAPSAIRVSSNGRLAYAAVESLPLPPEPDETGALSLIELRHHHCRWPFGSEPPYTFCGADRAGEGPYCAKHTRKAFKPIPPRPLRAPPELTVMSARSLRKAANG